MNELTTHARKLYEQFKPFLPVISDLRNSCLKFTKLFIIYKFLKRKRHWVKLSEICGVNFENETAISF